MPMQVHNVSTLTARYQTTVPSAVRQRLNLRKGDRLRYVQGEDGRIYIEAARDDAADPALAAFLDLLADDIAAHPARLRAFDGGLRDRLAALAADAPVDLDAPLDPADA